MAAFGIPSLQRLSIRLLLLAIGLGGGGLTLSLYLLQRQDETAEAVRWFKTETESVVQNLQEALSRSAALPQTAAAVARVVPRLDAGIWRKFVQDVRPFDSTPGLIGFGLAERVAENQLDDFAERMAREGQGALRVYPRTGPGPYWPVTYAEPEDVARYVRGFNLGSEASRRKALAYASDNAEVGMTGLISVGFSYEARKPPGFLMFYPVYAGGQVPEDVDGRRAALTGYALAIFRLDRLIDGLAAGRKDSHVISLYDMEAPTPQLAYRSSRQDEVEDDTFRERTGIAFGGHAWRLDVAATPDYVDRIDRQRSTGVLLAGVLATLALMALVLLQTRGRQQAEAMAQAMSETARRGEAHYRALVLASSDWYWQQDEHYRFTELSSGFDRTHQDVNLALGRCRWELPIDLTPTQWAVHRADLEAHRPFQDFEYRIVGHDGQWHWFSVNGAPIFADDGHFAGYRGTARDITARKNAEHQQGLVNLAFNVAPEPAYIYRLDTHEVVYLNDEVCSCLGYRREELIGRPLSELEPDMPEEAVRELERSLRASGRVVREAQLHGKDGRAVAVELRLSLLEVDATRYAMVLARDVSACMRREAELLERCQKLTTTIQARTDELLAAKTAAERADQVKSEFLINMSEELRQPMHAIESAARFVRGRVDTAADAGMATMLDGILDHASRLLALIDNLIDLSGIEAGHLTLNLRPVDLAALAEDARNDLIPMLSATRLSCTVVATADLAFVRADAGRISQVVRTLLVNAIRVSREDTDITVTLTAAELPGRRADDRIRLPAVRLAIADSGSGIAADELDRIFKVAAEAASHHSGADNQIGSLRVCHDIVVAHGGIMTAKNRDGGGTEFEVLLMAVNGKDSG